METFKDLILQILKEAKRKGVKKIESVRLVKLAYLSEYFFYKRTNKRLTNAKWIAYKYGPWSPEYVKIIKDPEILEERKITSLGRLVKLIGGENSLNEDFIKDYEARAIIRNVVNEWINADINKLLDFVYFHTTPMEEAKYKETLKFEKANVSEKKIVISKDELRELKNKFKERLKKLKHTKKRNLYPLPSLASPYKEAVKKALLKIYEEDETGRIPVVKFDISKAKLKGAFERNP